MEPSAGFPALTNRHMQNQSLLRHAAMVGLFGIVLYAACLLWRYTMTDPAVIAFHLTALKSAFPGFQGLDTSSILIGGVWSFVYFFLGSVIFHSLHRNCPCKKM